MADGAPLEIDFLKRPTDIGRAVDMRVPPEVLPTLVDVLKKSGVPHQVLVENIQSLMDQQKEIQDSANGTFNIHIYHTYDEIVRWLRLLGSTTRTECRVFSIGNSYEGRPLVVIRIGGVAPEKPVVWIDAGIHAREWIAPATAVYLIAKLVGGSTHVTQLLRHYTIYVMPVANPDGYQYTWTNDRMWRKTRSVNSRSTCQGTDPNRNWNFHWAVDYISSFHLTADFNAIKSHHNPLGEGIRKRHQFCGVVNGADPEVT
ncbi:Carboxypeptidase A2 [Lamellibrachia satsuma]|nr:Carboxypeptidase A2 [Lamellibrachia satsuma]